MLKKLLFGLVVFVATSAVYAGNDTPTDVQFNFATAAPLTLSSPSCKRPLQIPQGMDYETLCMDCVCSDRMTFHVTSTDYNGNEVEIAELFYNNYLPTGTINTENKFMRCYAYPTGGGQAGMAVPNYTCTQQFAGSQAKSFRK